MKVEIKISSEVEETCAFIYTSKLTPDLMKIVELLEGVELQASLLVAKKDDKSFVIEPDQVEIVRTEGGVIKIYNQSSQDFIVNKALHELLEQLGSNFIRISKSTIVNINAVDHLSPSFNGTMYIMMKNGLNDYISRKYLGDFKKRLGL